MATKNPLYIVEERFKVVCGIGGDLSHYPLTSKDDIQFETDKDKSREFAEVFTPLHIVDQMLYCVPQMSKDTHNLDLCSGYGQFTIRMLRNLYLKHRGLNILKYLKEHHYFAELQLSSCFKLLWTFTTDINLYIGDALKLNKLPMNAKGIWYYLEDLDQWINVTRLVKLLMVKELKVFQDLSGMKSLPESKLFVYPFEKEAKFVKIFSAMMDTVNKNCKEYKSAMKQIIQTKAGRQHLIQLVSDAASAVEQNWQNHSTPEWLIREMVNLVPEVTTLKKILVLFNIEFLECLVKEKGISPSRIDFGYDSEAEGELAKAIYKVGIFSVDHCMEVFKASTVEASNKRGGYDVVFSNPPYQINDGGGTGTSAVPIYHEIVMHVIDKLNPHYLCMITPSRWMAGGKGLDDYRVRMLADKRIRSIVDFPGTQDVFNTVSIPGGVSYFLWDRDYSGLCDFNGSMRNLGEFDVVVRDNTSCQILRKVLVKAKMFCNNIVLPRKPFGLCSNFDGWVSENTEGAVKCMSTGKILKSVSHTAYTDNNNIIHLWKVLISKATIEGSTFSGTVKQLLMGFMVLPPNQICTETYLVAGTFNTKREAESYASYMKTKFYRFMLSLRVITQNISMDKFSWVPDFGDYSHAYTDKDLYQHFGLTKKEIEHIEKSIKAIK